MTNSEPLAPSSSTTNTLWITVSPESTMEILSATEVDQLVALSGTEAHSLFRRCALAVLNTGSTIDDTNQVLQLYSSFDIKFIRQSRGIKLLLSNAPTSAFVDGRMIRGIRTQLFSVLRDVLYVLNEIMQSSRFDLDSSEGITNIVFHILRNANLLHSNSQTPIVVCWGGHSISRKEYDFTKEVGYQLGLREINIITGCGPGAMKGPMKGAAIGHAKQHNRNGRYIGITEPGIIAAESPNPIVNELVILPDIEKRLEAFVRTGHGIIVFPGGAGTAEEILYILGILLHPANKDIPFPLIFACSKESESYFQQIDEFIGLTLGKEAQSKYEIISNDPARVAHTIKQGTDAVFKYRKQHKDAFYFNWMLQLNIELQIPFEPTHQNMSKLNLSPQLPPHELAASLRQAFSGIVAGNVKEQGLRAIKEHGVYEIHGDPNILKPLDKLLRTFVKEGRMKIGTSTYNPCYEIMH
ncbi:LOG family protein [Gammaproteobacteria bacterium 45_16_T64]|nr:LOG family protein [Gammaproteobacteria bacterium 45_16_T64]